MLYVLTCIDKADSLTIRQETRPAHLDYLKSAGDKLKLAGPFLDAEGSPIGSLIILDAASAGAAQIFANNDPYARAGLFERVTIRPFKAAAGMTVAGFQ